ncbi:MAG: alkaline phosphatase family protein [Baekduia sp.]
MSRPRAVLAVIDGAGPEATQAAIDGGEAPVLAEIARRGPGVRPLAAAFPSVTPVCATAIATGALQDEHEIPGMNWWSRKAGRYVEYGSSFRAARRHGIQRQLVDTVYRLNGEHLSTGVRTVYETLDDAGVRTAGTTFLVYRGRHQQQVSKETALSRIAGTIFREPVLGPRELYYADIFATRETGCRSQLGKPGVRDQHSGCVGAYLAERDLFDFLLLSLPDNDTASHRAGPHGQHEEIAVADDQIRRVAEAAGGIDRFLDAHAVIVCSDHGHGHVERTFDLHAAFGDFQIAQPTPPMRENRKAAQEQAAGAEIALCPNQRAAMVYVLDRERRQELIPRLVETAASVPVVDVICRLEGDEAVVTAPARGELRFRPGGDLLDDRGNRWTVDGDLDAIKAHVAAGRILSRRYPDALRRVWAGLCCETSGDVLLSAADGHEFLDWGGVGHEDGGSHGSLHASDSLGTLLYSGCELLAPSADALPDFTASLSDVAPMVYRHFGLA